MVLVWALSLAHTASASSLSFLVISWTLQGVRDSVNVFGDLSNLCRSLQHEWEEHQALLVCPGALLPTAVGALAGLLSGLLLGYCVGRRASPTIQHTYVSSPLRTGPALRTVDFSASLVSNTPTVVSTAVEEPASGGPSGTTHPHLKRRKGVGNARPF